MKPAAALLALAAACSHPAPAPPAPRATGPAVSRSIALSADGKSLWVVNAESDSLTQIDVATRTRAREVLLGAAPPAVDSRTLRFEPNVRPRALALVDSLGRAYVAGQSANRVYVVDTAAGAVTTSIPVGAEPTAVVASNDGASVYVVNHQSATVQRIDTATNTVAATLAVGEHPWGASLSADGARLYVTHLLLGPAVTTLATATFTLERVTPLPPQPADPGHDKLVPNGVTRGAYTVVPRPTTGELWVPHLLLAVGTAQPALDFQSTVFPTLTLLSPDAASVTNRLLFRPSSHLTGAGSFTDSVSGPRDVAFTPDGATALVAMAQSEDVMVFDAATGFERQLVRPTPSALVEGIVVDAAGTHAYLQGRSTHDVTVLSITPGVDGPTVAVDGPPIDALATDPMPPDLRRGLRLFYSANSARFPLTTNFWVACSTCHLEGQSDAVTWRFAQGPRDTPSNAGGPINTGFLFRQAQRNDVLDYDKTIRVEQGGDYHRADAAELPDLQALARFTNYAIPFPQNPYRSADGALTPAQARGKGLFAERCASCHDGDYLTDSGEGNPALDLGGTVLLHDIGTCVTAGDYPDQPDVDVAGHPRTACDFDTPTLRGIFATAPYLHDGSAATLGDVVARLSFSKDLDAAGQSDLVAYLKTL